ncbi:C40 family peptidase [Dokdonella sp.]|uniref:C40 family peptidase n=1 Tax=Dokdonella sp. TaxID=2291710 RepID=UPI0025C333BE|nr:C40 family peptidase [Dokdonella sp.]
MTLSALFAFFASLGAAQAAPSLGIDLGAFGLDRPGAFASTALPASGVLTLDDAAATDYGPPALTATERTSHLRQLLNDFSMTLRGIRYRRGGQDPKTGFDCSGFVRYVYQHTVGALLPSNSASQYQAGTNIARDEMKTGDLVFFRTHGKRISHVGIYIGDNRFIHSPSTGKRVSVSNLDETYWARRFAGARRPQVLG